MMKKIQMTSNLLFDVRLYNEYPYMYSSDKGNGVVEFTFSKTPILSPSIIEQAKIKKVLDNNKNENNFIIKDYFREINTYYNGKEDMDDRKN